MSKPFYFILNYSFLFLITTTLRAQNQELKGKVVASEDGSPLAGTVVALKDTLLTIATTADADGNYSLSVPTGPHTLVFRYAGYKDLEVNTGSRLEIDVVLLPDLNELNEIVVTGVAEGTSTNKLGFALGKVRKETLEQVPAADAASALRGKIAGITVIQGSGTPGTPPAIQLRGATSIQSGLSPREGEGSTGFGQGPLIIVDGQITQGGLEDINMQDVERIEVIKGAAAASLYGSLAGNGVIQIITRRGSQTSNKTSITVRNEVGFTNLQKQLPLAKHHYYKLRTDGNFLTRDSIFPNPNDSEDLDTITSRVPQESLVLDQPFNKLYDQQELLFENKVFFTNYIQLATTGDRTKLLASIENYSNQGVITGLPSYSRRNVRFNLDHRLTQKFKISLSSLYSRISGPQSIQRDQSGVFYGALLIDPDLNLNGVNPDGSPYQAFFKDRGDNANNPLYEANNLVYKNESDRILANLQMEYKLAKWWRVEGQYSLDNNYGTLEFYRRKGYLNVLYPTGDPGRLVKNTTNSSYQVATLSSYFHHNLGALKTSLALKYQYEMDLTREVNATGDNFTVSGIPQFQGFNNQNLSLNSNTFDIRSENYFAVLNLDFKDRYVLEGVVRRDGSSLFGPETRYLNFFRVSGTYLLSEDVKFKHINNWRLRASYGTSGTRPFSFSSRYDVYNLENGASVPSQLANTRLRPSHVAELEYGTNVHFLNRFAFEFNHSVTNVNDNILRAPVPAFTGNVFQWQNNSKLRTRTLEFSLDAQLIQKEKMNWELGFVGSNTKQRITDLQVPQYITDNGDFSPTSTGIKPFRIQEGVSIGAIYGNVLAQSVGELQIDANGNVTNIDKQQLASLLRGLGTSENITLQSDDFEINDQGFLILKDPVTGQSLQYTVNERAVRLIDPATRVPLVRQIGDAIPKFVSSIRSTLSVGSFSLYFLFDTQWGGNVYNYTKQLLYFNLRAADLDQTDRPLEVRHSTNYYNGSIYNGGSAVNYFVEKGSFTSLREVNLSYNLNRKTLEKLWKVGNLIYDARISVIGRNLATFTKYSGYNPEVSSNNQSTTYRLDNFSYPIFRTFTCAVQLRF